MPIRRPRLLMQPTQSALNVLRNMSPDNPARRIAAAVQANADQPVTENKPDPLFPAGEVPRPKWDGKPPTEEELKVFRKRRERLILSGNMRELRAGNAYYYYHPSELSGSMGFPASGSDQNGG